MESTTNLKTASAYVNNLLLARGLLRNGAPVDFAQLGAPSKKDKESNVATAAQVINIVHDLILRRDRDQDHQETIAHTLRSLRTENGRHAAENERLNAQNGELKRQLVQQQGATRAAQRELHTVEAAARALRDEVARAKSTLAQVRTQCANDVRKRDVQLQRLKTHLTVQQRGSKTAITAPSITIAGGGGGGQAGSRREEYEEGPSLDDVDYSLKQETTEFLTQLSQSLSDENDALIGLIKNTLTTLKELQGLPHNQTQQTVDGNSNSDSGVDVGDDQVQVLTVSYDRLSADLEGVLGSLKELLSNPSFAPIEEVHVREEEICRLREGWEKMESRWGEAVMMMQGWRERMQSGGTTVNLEELKMGLGLGEGLDFGNSPSAKNRQASLVSEGISEETGTPEEDSDQDSANDDLHLPEDEPSFDGTEESSVPEVDKDSFDVESKPTSSVPRLQEQNANIDRPAGSKPRQVSFEATTGQENSGPVADVGKDLERLSLVGKDKTNARKASRTRLPSRQMPAKDDKQTQTRTQTKSRLTLGRQHKSSPGPEPVLSVQQKLKLAECEARRVSQGSSLSSSSSSPPMDLNATSRNAARAAAARHGERATTVAVAAAAAAAAAATATVSSPVKRSGIGGRAQRGGRRRKSTLSPEELENLMMAGDGDGDGDGGGDGGVER